MRVIPSFRTIGVFCLTIVGAASLLQSQASAQRRLTAEDLVNLKRLSEPRISPAGDQVAVVVTGPGPDHRRNADIWTASRDGLVLKRITDNPGPDTHPRWSPDGSILAFLSRKPGETAARVYFYSTAGNTIRPVTRADSRVLDFRWSPDGGSLALAVRDPLSAEIRKRRAVGDDARVVGRDFRHVRLWLMEISSGQARLLTQQDMTVREFEFSPDGRTLAVLASPCPTPECYEYHSHLGLLRVATGEQTILTDRINALTGPCFSMDGRWIAYIGPVGRFKERGILKVIATDGGESRDLLKDFRGNVWDLHWHPGWNSVLASVARGVQHQLISVDLQERTRFLFQMDHSRIPYWQRTWSVSSDGKWAAYLSEAEASPPELWVSSLEGTGRKQLTRFNDDLRSVVLGRVEQFRWDNPDDGSPVEGIVVKPPDYQPGLAYPLVTWFHGGPAYNWGLGAQIESWAQLFAANGYLVFLPNFRGSSGRGMEWMTANVRNWGSGPMSDVMSGVSALIRRGWADKRRLYIGGRSYGGYLTAWIITQTDRFHAACVDAGVTDLVTEFQLTDEPSFLTGYFNATPYEDPEIYRSNSPLTYTETVRTPVLIVHGENDRRVPASQARQFHSALRHYGVEAELVLYPREAHGIREYAHQLDLIKRVLIWFGDHPRR